MNHIINILAKYRFYIDTSQNEQSKLCIATNVYNTKQNQYNDINLLNDFNHLLESHRHEFEEIYNMLKNEIYNNNDCRLRECLSMRRHHRDRHKITENEEILNELYNGNDDIVSQQILDRAHCHYMHTFDIGYRLTKRDKQDIMNEEKKL